MDKLSNAELRTIKERAEDTSFEKAYVKGDPWKGYEVRNEGNGLVIAETSTESDAEFIAAAREDVPSLLDHIAEQDEWIETLEESAKHNRFYSRNLEKENAQQQAEIEQLQKEVSRLSEAENLLSEAHDIMDDVHLYDTDLYRAISRYFYGEDDGE